MLLHQHFSDNVMNANPAFCRKLLTISLAFVGAHLCSGIFALLDSHLFHCQSKIVGSLQASPSQWSKRAIPKLCKAQVSSVFFVALFQCGVCRQVKHLVMGKPGFAKKRAFDQQANHHGGI